jgi:hypothetical protein
MILNPGRCCLMMIILMSPAIPFSESCPGPAVLTLAHSHFLTRPISQLAADQNLNNNVDFGGMCHSGCPRVRDSKTSDPCNRNFTVTVTEKRHSHGRLVLLEHGHWELSLAQARGSATQPGNLNLLKHASGRLEPGPGTASSRRSIVPARRGARVDK